MSKRKSSSCDHKLSSHWRTNSDNKKQPVVSCDKCGMEWANCSCGKRH